MRKLSFNSLKLVIIVFLTISLIYPLLGMIINIKFVDLKLLMSSSAFLGIILNSLKVTITATIISITLAFFLAWSITRTSISGKIVLITLLTLPMFIPSISHGMGLIILFGAKGIFTTLFNIPFDLYGFNGIVIGSILYTLPIAFLMLLDVFEYEDYSLYEAGQTLGFSKLNTFSKITLPYMKRPLLTVTFAIFTMIFTDYGVPLSVGGKYMVLSTYMYREVIGLLNFSKGAIVGIILLFPAIISFLIDFFNQENDQTSYTVKDRKIQKNKVRDFLAIIFCGSIGILICIPIFSFGFLSIVEKYPLDLSLSFKNISEAMSMGVGDYFTNSIAMSLLTALLGTAIAYIAAYFTARGKKHYSNRILHLISIVSIAVPGLVLGLGYVVVFNNSFIYNTLFILVLVNIVHFFASPYLMAHNALCKFNKNFEEVGISLGIKSFYLLKDVFIPSTWGTILEMFSYYFINGMITISAISFLSASATKPLALMIPIFENQRLFEAAAFVSILILLTNVILKLGIMGLKYLLKQSQPSA